MTFRYKDVLYPQIIRVPDQASALEQLRRGVLVLIMPGERPKNLKFLCPCGCGDTISINLMREAGKAWQLGYEVGHGISIWPSVWLDVGCRSHFILRRNKARLLYGKVPRMTEEELERWWETSDGLT